ncbi:peptidoglycan-associated lipoprotein Pal [Piscinibacter terrae]|uniref:Peptidoglycan-associated lipoprotein n=1 Tax=Piscinibacter terrae TaxID=2496871 RepID=A0A3N7HTG2_9BURK|nr:peptidoglycan-associated lipoprotein Pal [Albitalea terrae]RQP25607.1 peptidoglycan-associated lipoprotein Pal [Albitalea terrae]
MRRLTVVGASLLVPVLMSACSSTPVAPAAAPVAQAAPAKAAQPATSTPAVAAPAQSSQVALHLDPNSALNREHSVFFEFDDSVIAKEWQPVVQRHGEYLSHASSLKVVVQGNADERGSAEYNLALGQRRAEAVKKALQLMGVKDTQVEAVSFGEEKPMATAHDEAAWHQNRRADIVYVK